jgi:hypothetical protein
MSAEVGEAPPSPISKGRGRNILLVVAAIVVVAILVVAAVVFLVIPGDDGDEDLIVPAPPSDLILQTFTAHYIILTWQSPSDQGGEADEYVLYCCGVGPNNITSSWEIDPIWSSWSMQSNQLNKGWTYEFYMVAVNDAGESVHSNIVTFTAFFVPGEIESDFLWGNGYVNLTWSPPAEDGGKPLTGFMIKRSIWNDYTSAPTNFTFGFDARSFNDTSVANGVTYEYAICGINEIGIGDGYGIRVVPGAPGMVFGILAVPGNGYVHVYWRPPADGGSPITKYQISRLLEGDWNFPKLFNVTGDIEDFNDTSVTNGIGYIYNIYAYNDLGGRCNDWSQGGSYVYPSSDPSNHVWNYPANSYHVGDFANYESTLGESYGGGLAWYINRTIEWVGPMTATVDVIKFCPPYNMTIHEDDFLLKTYAFMGDSDFDYLQAQLVGQESLSTKWGTLTVDHWTMSDSWGAEFGVWVHEGVMVKTQSYSSGTLLSETLLVDTNLAQITGH